MKKMTSTQQEFINDLVNQINPLMDEKSVFTLTFYYVAQQQMKEQEVYLTNLKVRDSLVVCFLDMFKFTLIKVVLDIDDKSKMSLSFKNPSNTDNDNQTDYENDKYSYEMISDRMVQAINNKIKTKNKPLYKIETSILKNKE